MDLPLNVSEEFDLAAMNEKFNKKEIWGSLGKGKDISVDGNLTQMNSHLTMADNKFDSKAVYRKDEFFLSLQPFDGDSWKRRFEPLESLIRDKETFADSQHVCGDSESPQEGVGSMQGSGIGRSGYHGGDRDQGR